MIEKILEVLFFLVALPALLLFPIYWLDWREYL